MKVVEELELRPVRLRDAVRYIGAFLRPIGIRLEVSGSLGEYRIDARTRSGTGGYRTITETVMTRVVKIANLPQGEEAFARVVAVIIADMVEQLLPRQDRKANDGADWPWTEWPWREEKIVASRPRAELTTGEGERLISFHD